MSGTGVKEDKIWCICWNSGLVYVGISMTGVDALCKLLVQYDFVLVYTMSVAGASSDAG